MRTLIVDDEPNARQVIRNILETYVDQVEIVGEADCVADAVQKINSLKPRLVLLDINMPDGTGFDVIKACKEVFFKFIIINLREFDYHFCFRFACGLCKKYKSHCTLFAK